MTRTLSNVIKLGTMAPDFSLPDPSGKIFTRDEIKGEHGLLVVFICNHCPYVKHIKEKFSELASQYIDKGIGVVAISSNDIVNYPDDAPEKMAEDARQFGYRFPYLYDESQQTARDYNAACTPDFFLFDADLKLAYCGQFDSSRPKNDLPVTGEDLIAAMDALIAGKQPSLEQIPSIGCNIKWKE